MNVDDLQGLIDEVKEARGILARRDQMVQEAETAERRRDKALATLAKAENDLAEVQARVGTESERFAHEKRRHDLILAEAQNDHNQRVKEMAEKFPLLRAAQVKEHEAYLAALSSERDQLAAQVESLRGEHAGLKATVADIKQRIGTL